MGYILIDTSVMLEILNVPNKAGKHITIMDEFRKKAKAGVTFFIPLATILETGNHIAQNGDGRQRLACAENFVDLVEKSLDGESPFKVLQFFDQEELRKWLQDFPASANRGESFGDLSIQKDLTRLHELKPREDISIWTLDGHLDSYSVNGER